MPDLLVFVVDKVNSDPIADAACHKRGDVIIVAETGSVWGRAEVVDPFRVVRVPDLPMDEAMALLGREYDTDPTTPSRTLQRRQFRLDLDRMADVFSGESPIVVDAETIRALKTRKPSIPDPAVL